MSLQAQINSVYSLLLEHLNSHQVILLHPQSRYRTLLINALLNDSIFPTFYYALSVDDIDVESFINGVIHDLNAQHPMFGRHLNFIPQGVYDNLDGNLYFLIDEFTKELAELQSHPYILILDEFDRCDVADDFQHFIERLCLNLPPQCRIIINSRTLPRISWLSLIAQNKAAVIFDDTPIVRDFYGFRNHDFSMLRAYTLGPGFVRLNGEYVDSWEGHLPRLLFFFALDRPVITRSEICASFWHDLTLDQAVNVFHVTKRRLHRALNADILAHNDGFYLIDPNLDIYFDAMDFVSVLIRARDTQNPNRIADYETAISLYRGPFLQGHSEAWVRERRHDFHMGFVEAIKFMANVWEERGKLEYAIHLLLRGLEQNLRLDDINHEVMRLYMKLGRRNEAAAHYQRVQRDYKSSNLTPSLLLLAYYAEIIQT
jgi:DNA-binding SARP family transcriptional activator